VTITDLGGGLHRIKGILTAECAAPLRAACDPYQGDSGHPFARTATGQDLDQATLRRLACDAGMTPILMNVLGVPLDVGRERRTVTPGIWKALVARDVGCIGEGCTRPASWCEVILPRSGNQRARPRTLIVSAR
jgi:hypothetical protein